VKIERNQNKTEEEVVNVVEHNDERPVPCLQAKFSQSRLVKGGHDSEHILDDGVMS